MQNVYGFYGERITEISLQLLCITANNSNEFLIFTGHSVLSLLH